MTILTNWREPSQLSGNLLLLWLSAVPLMASPGPATMSLAAVGALHGAGAGLRYLAGIISGTFCVLLLIAAGMTGLVLAVPALVWVLTAFAAGYILYLAWRIATAPPPGARNGASALPSFAGGYALAIANPKAYAAIGAVYSGHSIIAGDLFADAAVKVAALSAVIVAANIAWLVFGSAFSGFLRDPARGRIASITFALLLVASVALAVTGG
jgi:threonine/homoserine/homoserine lactone efflux protein